MCRGLCAYIFDVEKSEMIFESPFSAQDNVFHIRIHPKEWISWDLCISRDDYISVFLKEWFDGLIGLVGFEWQVFLKE